MNIKQYLNFQYKDIKFLSENKLFNRKIIIPPLIAYFFSIIIIFSCIWIGKNFVVEGINYSPGDILTILSKSWDAKKYTSIAVGGYAWNGDSHQYQNIAFFPLYPLIEKFLIISFGLSPIVILFPAFLFGLLSTIAFYYFSLKIMPEKYSKIAILGYVMYPGSTYFLKAYPYTLVNFLAILTLIALLEKKYLKAALWSGIGTAGAPLMVFFSLTIVIMIIFDGRFNNNNYILIKDKPFRITNISKKLGTCITAFSGILLFMIYQKLRFNDPLAFISAQKAWDYKPLYIRIYNLIFFKNLIGGNHPKHFIQEISHGSLASMDYHFHALINILILFIIFYLIWIQRKTTPYFVTLSSLLLIFGYIWFMESQAGFKGTYRLIYPAIVPAMIGIGDLARTKILLPIIIILTFSFLFFIESIIMIQGFVV